MNQYSCYYQQQKQQRCLFFVTVVVFLLTVSYLPTYASAAFFTSFCSPPNLRPLVQRASFFASVRKFNNGVQQQHTTTRTTTTLLQMTSSSNKEKNEKRIQDDPITNEKKRLSRPERKALERKKKRQQQKQQTNPKMIAKTKKQKHKKYKLHSKEGISQLTEESTAADVLRAIKRAQNYHDHHDLQNIEDFLLEECDETFAYGYRGSLLARLAVAALHFEDHIVARKAIDVRTKYHQETMKPMESAAVIRGLLRVHNVTDAFQILNDELSVIAPSSSTSLTESEVTMNNDKLKYRALSLASIASRHFFEGEPSLAVRACTMLAEIGPMVREAKLDADDLSMPWLRIISGASQCESKRRDGSLQPCSTEDSIELPCNLVYAVLNAMTTFPSDNSDDIFEALSNALVRRVLFVTGAVSLSGCPPPDRGEAVFIGRSNVGKSSLVNMITNRKSLAYTSKRPGKTKEFNFFTVNDKPGREKEIRFGDKIEGNKDRDSFYMVDLPGFGYAKVPEYQRQQWADFMSDYLANRKTLRVVFHLVDGRHGPIDEDTTIMKRVGENLPKDVAYVVVLTKADKNVKTASKKNNPGKVSRDVIQNLRETMRSNKVGNAPIIVTSSETKLGRDDIWRYLRLAAEA